MADEYPWRTAEREAVRWAIYKFLTRSGGRLFPLPPMDLTDEHARWAAEDQFWRQPVAVMSLGSERPLVGIFYGFRRGFGNVVYTEEYVVGHFSGPGATTRGHPGNIVDILRLPEEYDCWIPTEEGVT